MNIPGYLKLFNRGMKRIVFTRYFGIRKFLNAALLYTQFSFFKNSRVIGYPLKLSIDPSSICILHCPLCPTGQGKDGRTRGKMTLENFKKIVDDTGPYLYEIDLNKWGEPFLNEDIFDMVAYAHKKRIKVNIPSNFNVKLSEEDAEKLILNGLDRLHVSLDGLTQKVYETYRVGGNLKTVIENIKLIVRKKKELNKTNPTIILQFLVMRHNEHQLPNLEEFTKKIGADEFLIAGVRSSMEREVYETDKDKIEKTMNWLPKNEKYSRYDYEKKVRKIRKKYCYFPWFVSVINWNGSVSPCCGTYYEKEDFGNILKEGNFKKIWNNEKYQSARNAIARKKFKVANVCLNCLRTGFID
jgi:radical SAM protein with 4Fe4S-binding SPASM domain